MSYAWREDYPPSDRPPSDAKLEVWFMQGGVPVHRMQIIKKKGEDYRTGPLEHAFFGGRGCETAYFLWALAQSSYITPSPAITPERARNQALKLANELQHVVDGLREISGKP